MSDKPITSAAMIATRQGLLSYKEVISRLDKAEKLEQENENLKDFHNVESERLNKDIMLLKEENARLRSPHNVNISSSEYAELLSLNAELADVTRKNHEFVFYTEELKQENARLRSLLAEAIFWTDPSDDYFHSKTDLIKKVQKEFNMNQTGSIENGDMDSWLSYVKEKSE